MLLEPRVGFAYDAHGRRQDGRARRLRRVPQHARRREARCATLTQQPPVQLNPQALLRGHGHATSASTGTTFPSNVRGMDQKDVKTPVLYSFTHRRAARCRMGHGGGRRLRGLDAAPPEQVSKNINTCARRVRSSWPPEHRSRRGQPAAAGQLLPALPGLRQHRPCDGNDGIANYHSLQVAANRRFTRGLRVRPGLHVSRA